MDTFVERVRVDMEGKMEHALISFEGDGVWSALSPLPSHPVVSWLETNVFVWRGSFGLQKVLTSSIQVLELIKQIDGFMAIMDAYVQRFALLWVHILAGRNTMSYSTEQREIQLFSLYEERGGYVLADNKDEEQLPSRRCRHDCCAGK